MNDLIVWWNANGVAVVVAVIAVVMAAEGICRALESLCLLLLHFAAVTKTTRDDEALKGAAKRFHIAARAVAKVAHSLRPFSVKGR